MFGGGLMTKLIIAGVVIAIVGIVVGGFFLQQKSIIDDLQAKIDFQVKEIKILTDNNTKLTLSNASLEGQLSRKAEETENAYEELARLRVKDAASVNRLNEVEKILRDRTRMERVESIRKTRKSSLLLRLMDLEVKCQIENFSNVDGKCVRGKWIKTGERLVPKEEVEADETQ